MVFFLGSRGVRFRSQPLTQPLKVAIFTFKSDKLVIFCTQKITAYFSSAVELIERSTDLSAAVARSCAVFGLLKIEQTPDRPELCFAPFIYIKYRLGMDILNMSAAAGPITEHTTIFHAEKEFHAEIAVDINYHHTYNKFR